MVTLQDLQQVRRRVDRLEAELDDTRRLLTALERRLEEEKARGAEAPVAKAAVAPKVEADAGESVLPKAVATPPPLPPLPPVEPVRVAETPAPPRQARGRDVRATPVEPAPLRVWLERLQLWPPSQDEEGNAEARLGAWWATRVGALLAVVGVVFFGIHVSRHTPAWVKFAELLLVAGGVTALGRWIERRLAAFGEVVFAGGLALFFFAAYAGHAVPAVRVLPELWMSVLAQAAAVAGIVTAALWRRSAMIATLATGLGLVTAVVSARGGLDGHALIAGGFLSAMAVALRKTRGWEGPSVVAMPGSYAVAALGLWSAREAGAASAGSGMWPYLVGVAVLFYLRDWRRGAGSAKAAPTEETWFQGTNSSLALLCGLGAALGWHREALEVFYLGAAGLLAAGAWARARHAGRGDAAVAVFTAKATGALTLAVIELAGARDAAVALLVQAWVLAWTARRLGSGVLAAGAGIVVVVATGFFAAHGLAAAPLWSTDAARALVFTLGLALLATEGGRWLLAERAEARRAVEATAAAVATLGLLTGLSRWTPGGWEPALALGLGALFAGAARLRRGAACGWSAVALAAAAQAWLWFEATVPSVAETLRWNALIVVGATAVFGAATRRRDAAAAAWGASAIGAVLSAFALWPEDRAMFAAAALAAALGVVAAWVRDRRLPWIATLTVGLGVACWVSHGLDASGAWIGAAALAGWALPVWMRAGGRADAARRAEWSPETMERLQVLAATVLGLRALGAWLEGGELGLGLAIAATVVFALSLRPGLRPALAASWIFWAACALVAAFGRGHEAWWVSAALLAWAPALAWPRVPESWKTEPDGWRRHAAAGQVLAASVLGLVVATEAFAGAGVVFALAALVAVAAGVARPGAVKAARVAAGLLAACLVWMALDLVARGGAEGAGTGFAAVVTAAVVVAGSPLWLGRAGPAEARRLWLYLAGGSALATAFALFAAQDGDLAPYATVGWGLVAIGIFMAGLFGRVAPYRVLGLLGLGACVARVFVVDLDATLHRIVAFIVLGLVLLWVGFSYHRFKHLVSDADTFSDPSSKK